MISSIYLSSLPIFARTKCILFDMYVSNLAIDEAFTSEEIADSVLVVHAKDKPTPHYAGPILVSDP